jgi:cell division protein FtsB
VPTIVRRVIGVVLTIGAIYFTLQAGEFSTRDILQERSHRRQLLAQVDSLQHQADSLTRIERMIRTDPVTQERIAREDFGMVRSDNEIIYKFVTPSVSDSASTVKGQSGTP